MLRAWVLGFAVMTIAAAHNTVQRRDFCINTLATVSSPMVCRANAAERFAVSDILNLELAIGNEKANLNIELFREAAPASVNFLLAFARGELKAPCAEQPEFDIAAPSRVKMNQLKISRQCLDEQESDVTLEGSSVWRILPHRRIDFGRVASRFAAREPPQLPEETNNLRHKRGAVSVRRGGGAFEFTVAPDDNELLDSKSENLVVVGQIADASLPVLDLLGDLPTKGASFDVGNSPSVPPLGTKFARACEYGSPNPTCASFKPLRKVIVTRATASSVLR